MNGFEELTSIILIASAMSVLVHFLKQPLIVGYILSGVLAGGYFFNIVSNSSSALDLFSEMGIVILLFTIGLNLNPNSVKEAGKDSVLAGVSQVLICGIAGFALAKYVLGFTYIVSIFVGLALTLSSTIVVLKILSDRGQIDKLHSKISIGILLVQDIISAGILLFLSVFNHKDTGLQTYSQSVVITTFILKTLILLGIYYLLSKFILKRLASIFATSQETLLLFGLGSGFFMAFLFYKFGFSLEIGALFAGVAIASSNFAKEISSRLKPLQDFFIAMFFVLLGARLVVNDIQSMVVPIVLMLIFVLIVKLVMIFFIVNILGHRTRTSFYVAVSLTQVSEFSLIMLGLVAKFGYIDQNIVSMLTIVMMVSIVLSSYMMIYVDNLYNLLRKVLKRVEIRKNNYKVIDEDLKDLDAVVFGFDRIGHEFVDVFKKLKYKYLVIDINPKYINEAIESGVQAIYGDAEDYGFLEENNILNSRMIISTIPHFKTNQFLVEKYKRKNPKGIIIAIAHDESKSRDLYKKGASYVIMPYHLGAYHAGKMLAEFKENPKIFEIEKAVQFEKIKSLI